MGKSYSLSFIAELIGGELEGDPEKQIRGVGTIEDAGDGELIYVQDLRYLRQLEHTRAAAVIIPPGSTADNLCSISVQRPKLAFARVAALFSPVLPPAEKGIHRTAVIDDSARLGKDISIGAYTVIGKAVILGDEVVIGPLCSLGDNVRIGAGSYVFARVVVRERVSIGKDCIVHPGAVLGSDGFGFETDDDGNQIKIPQMGNLVIEDNVEIGANVTIDRAAMGTTKIGYGVKLDNLVHIAHNVKIGKGCLLCAQVGIAGSTTIGEGSVLGGQAGLVDHLEIGDHVKIGAQSGVIKSVKSNETISGYPARPHKKALKREAMLSRLEKMYDIMKELRERVSKLEREIAHEKRKSECSE